MQALRSHEQIRDANTRYHDVAATTYDAKWGIDFGEIGQSQVLGKVRKLLAAEVDAGFASALEVGFVMPPEPGADGAAQTSAA